MRRLAVECRRTRLPVLALLVGALLLVGCHGAQKSDQHRSRLEVRRGLLVEHALGGINGMSYTNSLEALRCNHRRGFRWFEVDLALTRDDQLVAFHTGLEPYAELEKPIEQLPFSEVQRAKYRNRYAIVRFVDVLNEARLLGDVVLVTDTKTWSPRMLSVVGGLLAGGTKGGAEVVLQSYGEKDIAAVAELANKIDADVILTLYGTRATDEMVVDMAKQHGVLAVVANQQRFTPLLAERLHASRIPILVHTVNDHEEIVKLTRAGADGFYTDRYLPYELIAANPNALLDCGAQPSTGQLHYSR